MSDTVFTLQDLGLAYRKAKVGLYYSSHVSLTSIADYESQLAEHLQALQAKYECNDRQYGDSRITHEKGKNNNISAIRCSKGLAV